MAIFYLVIAGLIGYFCGAFPSGFIYVKLIKGIDLRQHGSGRTGGTNSLRAAGWQVGVLTGLTDVLKGACAIWLVNWLFGSILADGTMPWAQIIAGIFSVVGHNWSVFIGWTGGAGTGPNVGWATALWPPLFFIALIVMVGLLVGVGMASVASLAMGAVIPIVFLILYFLQIGNIGLIHVFGGIISGLIVTWALRPNIQRLMDGTERVVGPRAKRMKKK